MTLDVFVLVLIAAVLHALWNFAARKAAGNLGVLWLGSCLASVVCLPFALFVQPSAASIRLALPYMVATGMMHGVYYLFMWKAYEKGEISFVYPIARGTGVAGTAVAASIFIHEQLSLFGIIGIAAISLGVLLLGLNELVSQKNIKTGLFALLLGATIIGYSVIDKVGVGKIHPIFYIFWMFVIASLVLSPYVLLRHRDACRTAWRTMKKYIILIGPGSMATYIIILFTYQIGQVSYIVAVREFSVVVGSVLGFLLLGERFTLGKCLGIAAITSGLVMVKLAQ